MMDNDPKYEAAESVVDAIIFDIRSRRGLRQTWEEIDEAIRAEIKARWIEIVYDKP